jgi:hypothetical protein
MKSETSGIEIPESITADDGTAYTMSPIESPLSLARKRYTAQMINEQIAMIKSGMSAEEVIAYYENKERGMKKKEKGFKPDMMQSTILEIPDLYSSVPLEPPPPVQRPSMQPNHFKAIKDHTEQPQLMKRRSAAFNNMDKITKPNHCVAFEGANQHNNHHHSGVRGDVIRTKSLQVMQRAGGPTPPHFLAMEMENQKKKKPSSNTRKPSPKRIERMSLNRSRNVADKSDSLPDVAEKNGKQRGKGTDLSVELNAFFAKQKKLSLVKGKQSTNKAPSVSLSTSNSSMESNGVDPQRAYDAEETNDWKHSRMRRHNGMTLDSSMRMERKNDGDRRGMIPNAFDTNSHSDDSIDFLNDTAPRGIVERHSSIRKKNSEGSERKEPKTSATERRGSFQKMERHAIVDMESLSMLEKEVSRTSGERRGSYKKIDRHAIVDDHFSFSGKVDRKKSDVLPDTSLRVAIERHFSEDGVDLYRQIKKGFPGDRLRKSSLEVSTMTTTTTTALNMPSQDSFAGDRKVGRRGSGVKTTTSNRVCSHSPPAPPSRSITLPTCHRSHSPGPRRRSRSPRPSISRNSNVIPLTEHPLFK